MLIKNAKIVSSKGIYAGDILVEGERIKKVGKGISSGGEQVIDASGLHAFFGATDAHVHFRVPGGEKKEDFYTGTCSAIAGGVTAVLDMPNTRPPTTTRNALEEKISTASSTSVCDFGFHFGATQGNLEDVKKTNPSSLKIYMGHSTGNLGVTEEGIRAHFASFPKEKPICLHAEDQGLIAEFSKTRKTHEEIRNSPVCAAAVCKAISYATPLSRRIHFCHASTETEITLARTYPKATIEVAPHYLFLSQKDISRLGFLKNVNPALRSQQEVSALWGSLPSAHIIASDHAPHTLQDKKGGASGFPGVQAMLPLMLDAAKKGRIRLEEVARLACENPPKIFGLAGRGTIAPGNFADIFLVNMSKKHKITSESQFSKCGWSPYEGMELCGKIEKVFCRGALACEENTILAKKGSGKLIMR